MAKTQFGETFDFCRNIKYIFLANKYNYWWKTCLFKFFPPEQAGPNFWNYIYLTYVCNNPPHPLKYFLSDFCQRSTLFWRYSEDPLWYIRLMSINKQKKLRRLYTYFQVILNLKGDISESQRYLYLINNANYSVVFLS